MEYVAFSYEGKVVLTQMNISGKFNFGWAALKRVCIARHRPKLLAVGEGGGLLACLHRKMVRARAPAHSLHKTS